MKGMLRVIVIILKISCNELTIWASMVCIFKIAVCISAIYI